MKKFSSLKIYYLDKGSSSSQSKSFLALIPKRSRIFKGADIYIKEGSFIIDREIFTREIEVQKEKLTGKTYKERTCFKHKASNLIYTKEKKGHGSYQNKINGYK